MIGGGEGGAKEDRAREIGSGEGCEGPGYVFDGEGRCLEARGYPSVILVGSLCLLAVFRGAEEGSGVGEGGRLRD